MTCVLLWSYRIYTKLFTICTSWEKAEIPQDEVQDLYYALHKWSECFHRVHTEVGHREFKRNQKEQ